MTTKIAWTNTTWNPIVGCSKISPGCDNCYAERMAHRQAHMGTEGYAIVTHKEGGWNGRVYLISYKDTLKRPLRWKKPRMVFVSSMGDLFHEQVPIEWFCKVYAIIAKCPQHTFQILTKRPEIALKYFEFNNNKFPDNVWFGVTAENQAMADKRIPKLLEIPAVVRFVSVEPMLEGISFVEFEEEQWYCKECDSWPNDVFMGCSSCGCGDSLEKRYSIHGLLDWVIVGAETGPGARPMKIEWAEKLVSDCRDAGVPCFVKALPVNGRVTDDMKLWRKDLQVRQWPEIKGAK